MTTSQKKTIIHTGTLLSSFVIFFFLSLLSTAHAEIAPYTPLVSIPGLTNQKMASLPDYLNKVYYLIITIGALYGVVKIAFAGVKYSLSDVITSKESAKEDIKGVLLGLAILLIPFIVLQTINPELTRLDVFSGAPKVQLKGSPTTGGSSGTTLNNADGSKNAEIQKTGAAPAGTKRDTCSYQPQRGAGGCWTEAQQNSSQCQTQKIACLDACATKSGTYQNVETGDNTGNIICTYPG